MHHYYADEIWRKLVNDKFQSRLNGFSLFMSPWKINKTLTFVPTPNASLHKYTLFNYTIHSPYKMHINIQEFEGTGESQYCDVFMTLQLALSPHKMHIYISMEKIVSRLELWTYVRMELDHYFWYHCDFVIGASIYPTLAHSRPKRGHFWCGNCCGWPEQCGALLRNTLEWDLL